MTIVLFLRCLFALCLAIGSGQAQESPAESPPNPYAGDLLTRLRLTGDWNGRRSSFAERGLSFDLFSTQFY